MIKRIRVVQVIWRLSIGGGIPVVGRQLLTGLDPARFDLHAVTVRPAFRDDQLDLLGPHVTVHPIGFRGAANRFDELRLGWAIAARAAALRPDVLHAHSGTARLSLLAGLRCPGASRVLEVHDPPYAGRHSRATDALELGMMRGLGWHPVAHSSAVRHATAAALGRPDDSVSLVPLGVPVPDAPARSLAEGSLRARLGLTPGTCLVSYAGRSVTKNVPLFVRVAREVIDRAPDNVAFLLVGDQAPEVHRLVEQLGLTDRLHIVPPLTRLQAAHESSDVFLSTSDDEGFGLAVAEAMAAAVPVVATAVGGIRDLVVDGVTGYLAERGDLATLADRVCRLVTDSCLRRAMGVAARQRIQNNFTVAHMLDGFSDLFLRRVQDEDRRNRGRRIHRRQSRASTHSAAVDK